MTPPTPPVDERGRPRAVPTHVIRYHLAPLIAAGYLPRTLATASGVTPQTIRAAINGDRATVKTGTARQLLTLTHRACLDAAPPGARVPAAGTTRRLQALAVLGWTGDRIAAETGLRDSTIWRATHAQTRTVLAATARAVADFYDRTWDTPPIPTGHHEAGWITRTIAAARENDWAPALAWDDDTIDDPDATPHTGAPQRRSLLVELEELLDLDGPWTWDGITARLGVTRSAIEHACGPDRGRRPDLLARITTPNQCGIAA